VKPFAPLSFEAGELGPMPHAEAPEFIERTYTMSGAQIEERFGDKTIPWGCWTRVICRYEPAKPGEPAGLYHRPSRTGFAYRGYRLD